MNRCHTHYAPLRARGSPRRRSVDRLNAMLRVLAADILYFDGAFVNHAVVMIFKCIEYKQLPFPLNVLRIMTTIARHRTQTIALSENLYICVLNNVKNIQIKTEKFLFVKQRLQK